MQCSLQTITIMRWAIIPVDHHPQVFGGGDTTKNTFWTHIDDDYAMHAQAVQLQTHEQQSTAAQLRVVRCACTRVN
jgi:hypothetical protein